jgi:hypothetical protein
MLCKADGIRSAVQSLLLPNHVVQLPFAGSEPTVFQTVSFSRFHLEALLLGFDSGADPPIRTGPPVRLLHKSILRGSRRGRRLRTPGAAPQTSEVRAQTLQATFRRNPSYRLEPFNRSA